jgi:hypothetical protein
MGNRFEQVTVIGYNTGGNFTIDVFKVLIMKVKIMFVYLGR